ncbi:Wall-associated receptor kinase, galacturonan-binding domain [Sesbania bispinosa]|nr:Wall-associated receptor kinase, galacturonan-binding domain [Sesbania bispinosa]
MSPLPLPPPYSFNAFFFLSLFFFFPIYVASTDAEGYIACAPFRCGNFSDISYPFWSRNQPDYCGDPKFKLDCQQGNVTTNIKSQKFHIVDINEKSQILKIARLDLLGLGESGPCPEKINVSLDLDFFSYTSHDDNYTILYDCCFDSYGSPVNIDPSKHFTCFKDGNPLDAYIVLNEGFEVKWSGVNGNKCDSCRNSGGRCGYNASANAFMCLCPNRQSYGGICYKSASAPKHPEQGHFATSTHSSF